MNRCINTIRPFWNTEINKIELKDLSPYSEKAVILRLYDGKCVPIKCCQLFDYIKNNPEALIEAYLGQKYLDRHR